MNRQREKQLPLLYRWTTGGLLSAVLQTIAKFHGNILTIHQSIPINGVATLTLSVDILPGRGDAEAMVEDIEKTEGIHYLKLQGGE